jgi:hypothetical protein
LIPKTPPYFKDPTFYLITPFFLSKVRMQANPSLALKQSWQHLWSGGIKALYRGVNASAFRQLTYGGMRLWLYAPIRDALVGPTTSQAALPLQIQLAAGALSGGISSAIMCPADVVKIRLQAGEAEYRGVFHAISSIIRNEGVHKLWRGVSATSTRAAVVAAAELGIYDFTKEKMLALPAFASQQSSVYGFASVFATLTSIAVSFPIDVAKTVMINQGIKGVPKVYRNMGHCMWSRFCERGPIGMYRGCLPSFSRSLLCNIVMFSLHEQIQHVFEGG